ncbi:ATP-binding protein [Streptomyces sp. NPDC088921]|uniref:ATP-binding protein n=1 Tax=unclassified Streptomyces TaxID=2593676 RepID=UPI003424E9BE
MTTASAAGKVRDDQEERAETWARDNQRHLVLYAEAVAARLDARQADADSRERAAAQMAEDVLAATGAPVALDRVTLLFGLTQFERDLLVAAAATDIGLPAATEPVTFARALCTLPGAHWSALLPDAPLRHWQLVDLPAGLPAGPGGLAHLPLTVDERILHGLLGAVTLDSRLSGRARLAEEVCHLTEHQSAFVAQLAALVSVGPSAQAVVLVGEDRLTRRQAAIKAGCVLGLSTLVADGADLPADPPTADLYARMLAREAALGNRLVLVEAEPTGGGWEGSPCGLSTAVRRLAAAARSYGVPLVVASDDASPRAELPLLRLPPAGPADRRALFTEALEAYGLRDDPAGLADRHPLTPAAIALGVERAARLAAVPGAEPDVAAACRAVADRPLHGLAELRHPSGRLDDLVLAEPAERALRALLAQVRQRHRVHNEWGYPGQARGLAVTALFTGPSGTGKTTAAEAVAAELGLDVIFADLSQVVSKYIGETEKNLARLFDAAEAGAVLLFDEGDALFGRRTQVRDSRDRYANLEVSYLLQRLETFSGISIVTTNQKESIDSAFTRRIRFVVNFPFPDPEQRARLWDRAFPASVPVDGLDPVRLAQVAVAGGTIAQLALHAAFLAADAGEPVRMAHVREAVQIECDKLDRPLSLHEIRGW